MDMIYNCLTNFHYHNYFLPLSPSHTFVVWLRCYSKHNKLDKYFLMDFTLVLKRVISRYESPFKNTAFKYIYTLPFQLWRNLNDLLLWTPSHKGLVISFFKNLKKNLCCIKWSIVPQWNHPFISTKFGLKPQPYGLF